MRGEGIANFGAWRRGGGMVIGKIYIIPNPPGEVAMAVDIPHEPKQKNQIILSQIGA